MTGLFAKGSKLKAKKYFALAFGAYLMLGVGCASLSHQEQMSRNDATRNMDGKAQSAWENQAYQATADYHFTLAQAYSAEGRVDRAIEEYRAALAFDANSSILHARLANEYMKKGSASFAIEEAKRSIELDPKNVDTRLMLGGIYSVGGQEDLALAEYNEILRFQPDQDEAAVFKAQVLVEKERFPEALKFIRAFTSKVKDSAAAWFYAGKLEQSQDNMDAAIHGYRMALSVRPGFTQATLALGMIFETHGENSKAQEIYEAQMEERPDLQIGSRLVTIDLKANRFDAALKTLSVMKVLDPEDLNTQMKIGLVFMQQEQWTHAEEVFKGILDKVPDSDKVNFYLAAVYEEQGKLQESVDLLQKVSADSKLFEDANLHSAALYRKLLKKDLALSVLEGAIKKSPENPALYIVLASLHEDNRNLTDAARALETGLKLFPEHEKLRYFYGAILDKMGKQDEAIVEMQKVVQGNPNNPDALNFIAYSWTSQGVHLKDAEAMLKKALKISPNSPFILDSMGWNQFMLGNNEDALVYLEKAVSLKSDETAILDHLVQVYSRNEMPERAQAVKLKMNQMVGDSSRSPASVEEK